MVCLVSIPYLSALALDEADYSIADSLQLSNAVKPGLLKHPLFATVDDLGNLFVIDGPAKALKKGQLEKQKPYSIRLLTDTDQDGVYDQAITFADGLVYPGGMEWIYDSLYVMSPPGLLYFEDSNGDGKAEVKQTLIDGFGFTGKGVDFSGPYLHPNGRLYFGHARAKFESDDHRGEAACIWSSDINGQDIRKHACGGMQAIGEFDFTETGDLVGTTSEFYPKKDALIHWLYGGVYSTVDDGGSPLNELHSYELGSRGVCRYRTGQLNDEWRNNWIVAHSGSNTVSCSKIKRKASGFEHSKVIQLLEITKDNSRITDVVEVHNGDLLIVDSGKQGGIYRISKADTEYQPADIPKLSKWQEMDPIDVAELLQSDNPFVQERAITELAVRGHSSIPELQIILEENEAASPRLKRNAIWALARMKSTESPELIEKVLLDADPSVQIAACNAIAATRSWQQVAETQNNDIRLELQRNETISGILSRLVSGGTSDVARNAATALGVMGEGRAAEVLLSRIGRRENDPELHYSMNLALKEMEASEPLLEALNRGNSHQQRAALLALNKMESYQLTPIDIILFLDQDDPVLNDTVNTIVKSHPEWNESIANQFYFYSDALSKIRRQRILALAPSFASAKSMQSFVKYLNSSESSEKKKLAKQLADHF